MKSPKNKKLTKKDKADMCSFNILRAKNGESKLTEEQYWNYIFGKGLPKSSKPVKETKYSGLNIPSWANDTSKIPSVREDHTYVATKARDEYKKEVSKNYIVSIAYNKGGYQVLRREEVLTAGRKI